MPRKNEQRLDGAVGARAASMRPRPDAAEKPDVVDEGAEGLAVLQ